MCILIVLLVLQRILQSITIIHTPRAEVCVHDFEIKKTLRLFKKYPKLFSQCIASGRTGLDHDVRLGHACPWLLHRGKASGGSCAKEARPKLPLRSSTGVSP